VSHGRGKRSDFGKDTGLQSRMLLTMFLLGLLYVVFIGVLIAVGAGAGIIVIVALVMLGGQLFASDKIALATARRQRGLPRRSPRAARDHRAPLRAGQPAQARASA